MQQSTGEFLFHCYFLPMTELSYETSVRPRICFLAYRHIAELAAPIVAEYAHRAEIVVIEAAFDVALSIARERLKAETVDVFISAGANGAILRKNIDARYLGIEHGDVDMLARAALVALRERGEYAHGAEDAAA